MSNLKDKLRQFGKNFRNATYRFMYGRYGIDELYRFLTTVILILMVLFMFTRIPIIYYLELILLIYSSFRFFSKNIYKRRAENDWYLAKTKTVRKKYRDLIRRLRDRKTYRYRTCPNCKQTLRLPYRKGTHNVKCPKCGHTFEVKI